MRPVSACLLRGPVPWSLDQTGTFLCRSLANEETGTVWPERQREKEHEQNNIQISFCTYDIEHTYFYKSALMVLLRHAGVKSYVDSSTLQSVMQTVRESQQGQDKKGCHGTRGKKGGRRSQRLWDSKAGRVQSQMETSD